MDLAALQLQSRSDVMERMKKSIEEWEDRWRDGYERLTNNGSI